MAIQISGTTVIDNNRNIIDFSEKVVNLGSVTTSATINLADGSFFTATLAGNCTFTFTPGAAAGAEAFTLFLRNDATPGRTITWPASVKWPNATLPTRTTTANRADVYSFFTTDGGTTWYGIISIYNYA